MHRVAQDGVGFVFGVGFVSDDLIRSAVCAGLCRMLRGCFRATAQPVSLPSSRMRSRLFLTDRGPGKTRCVASLRCFAAQRLLHGDHVLRYYSARKCTQDRSHFGLRCRIHIETSVVPEELQAKDVGLALPHLLLGCIRRGSSGKNQHLQGLRRDRT